MFSKEEILVRSKIQKDFSLFANKCLYIRDKKGKIVPLTLNSAQIAIDNKLEEQVKLKKPLRFIVLKARQEGVSTYFEARIYHRQSNYTNRKAMIVAHESDASTNLFNMFKRYYEYTPIEFQASVEHSNEKKLSFEQLKSEIKIATAESREKLGRSATIQDLHCSEVAFWGNAKDSMLALLQVVPDEPNTMVVVESTANGIGGWFYDTWQDAVKGNNDFIPIFLAWFDLEEYTKYFETNSEKESLINSLTDYENTLIKNYNLTYEQINWYRYTKRNKCNNDDDQMKQEYPSTPDEAFITSGRPVFDMTICFDNYSKAKEPIKIGNLEYEYTKTNGEWVISGVKFVDNISGFLKIYQEFQVKEHEQNVFAIGCDVAEGLEQGDYNSIRILDRRKMNIVAEWHGHIDPDVLAEEQHKIHLWLKGKAFFGTEANNHGLTTIVGAYKLGVKQYYREDFQKGYEAGKMELGFKTTQVSKPFAINILAEAIREKSFTDNSKLFWGETLTFVKNAKGQMQAQDKDKDPGIKCFDDTVMSTAIMFMVHNWMPKYYAGQLNDMPDFWQEKILRDKRKKQLNNSGLTAMSG